MVYLKNEADEICRLKFGAKRVSNLLTEPLKPQRQTKVPSDICA